MFKTVLGRYAFYITVLASVFAMGYRVCELINF